MAVVGPADYHGGVTLQMLTDIGRERGPDLQLKIDDTLLAFQGGPSHTKDIITSSSSITEVLNVISYLVSTGGGARNFGTLVDTTNSVLSTFGGVVPATGYYDAQPKDVTPAVAGVAGGAGVAAGADIANHEPFLNAAGTAATTQFISLNDFSVNVGGGGGGAAATEAFIPVNILRRTGGIDGGAGINKVIHTTAAAADFRRLTANGANAIPLLSDCVKQMITILKKTREIFGPKGWTDLFQKVKGGGGSSKKAKRTHRRHRRRYSSKQY
jgi:hypothetical protein